MKLSVQRINPDAKLPSYAHPGDAGMDLYSVDEKALKPGERALVATGIKIGVPNGYEAQVRPKSGLAINHGLGVLNSPGTIDAGYRGEVKVIVINLSDKEYVVRKGEKIAQIVIGKVEEATVEEVKELGDTKRGAGGFGSTGLK